MVSEGAWVLSLWCTLTGNVWRKVLRWKGVIYDWGNGIFCVELVQHKRTFEAVRREVEHLQIHEIADRRRDGACAPQGTRGNIP